MQKQAEYSESEVEAPSQGQPKQDRDLSDLLAESDDLLNEIDEILDQEEQEKKIKLSDLIREGALFGEQAFDQLENEGATCTLGAAWVGIKNRGLI